MIVVMEHTAAAEQVDRVIETMVEHGYDVHRSTGAEHIILGAIGRTGLLDPVEIEQLPGVRQVVVISRSFRQVERLAFPQGRQVKIGNLSLGGGDVGLIPLLTAIPEEGWADHFVRTEGNPRVAAIRTDSRLQPSVLREISRHWKQTFFSLILEIPGFSIWGDLSGCGDAFLLPRSVWKEEVFLREAVKMGKPLLLNIPAGCPVEEVLIAADRIFCRDFPHIVLTLSFGSEGTGLPTLNPDALLQLKKSTFLPVLTDFTGAGLLREKLQMLCQAAIASGADGVVCDLQPASKGIRALDDASCGLLAERLRKIAAVIRSS